MFSNTQNEKCLVKKFENLLLYLLKFLFFTLQTVKIFIILYKPNISWLFIIHFCFHELLWYQLHVFTSYIIFKNIKTKRFEGKWRWVVFVHCKTAKYVFYKNYSSIIYSKSFCIDTKFIIVLKYLETWTFLLFFLWQFFHMNVYTFFFGLPLMFGISPKLCARKTTMDNFGWYFFTVFCKLSLFTFSLIFFINRIGFLLFL